MDAGADANARDSGDDPILYTAIDGGNSEIVRILVDAGADVNARDGEDNPLLYTAVSRNYSEIVQVLVDAGADANARDSGDDPVLYTAIDGSNSKIVRILVDAGADVNAREKCGTSLVGLAFEKSESEIVQILIDAGAEIDFRGDVPVAPSLSAKTAVAELLFFWDTYIIINWYAVGEATHYQVYRGDGHRCIANVSAPQTTVRSSDHLASYRVKACNKSVCSPFSNTITGR